MLLPKHIIQEQQPDYICKLCGTGLFLIFSIQGRYGQKIGSNSSINAEMLSDDSCYIISKASSNHPHVSASNLSPKHEKTLHSKVKWNPATRGSSESNTRSMRVLFFKQQGCPPASVRNDLCRSH